MGRCATAGDVAGEARFEGRVDGGSRGRRETGVLVRAVGAGERGRAERSAGVPQSPAGDDTAGTHGRVMFEGRVQSGGGQGGRERVLGWSRVGARRGSANALGGGVGGRGSSVLPGGGSRRAGERGRGVFRPRRCGSASGGARAAGVARAIHRVVRGGWGAACGGGGRPGGRAGGGGWWRGGTPRTAGVQGGRGWRDVRGCCGLRGGFRPRERASGWERCRRAGVRRRTFKPQGRAGRCRVGVGGWVVLSTSAACDRDGLVESPLGGTNVGASGRQRVPRYRKVGVCWPESGYL